MLSVALVGPDGAGKTTVGRRLEGALAVPAKYLYMGVNADAGTNLLPTTRLAHALKRAMGAAPDTAGPPDPLAARIGPKPSGLGARAKAATRRGLRLVNRVSEEWYLQAVARWHGRRGAVIIFDRHFLADYFAHDVAGGAGLPLSRRLHGLLLAKAYPEPDLVVLLDAPPEVLLARKGEGTVESLERRRQEYLRYGDHVEDFVVVDVTQPVDDVVREVAGLIDQRFGHPISRQGASSGDRFPTEAAL